MYSFTAIGRIASDIDLKYTKEKGTAVAKFSFAFDDPDAKDKTTFLPLTAWEKTAENLAQYKQKGEEISVFIKIANHNYEDKDGKKHYGYNFTATRIKYIGKKKEQEGGEDNA